MYRFNRYSPYVFFAVSVWKDEIGKFLQNQIQKWQKKKEKHKDYNSQNGTDSCIFLAIYSYIFIKILIILYIEKAMD